MAWSDEPTDAQLNAFYKLIHWEVPNNIAQKATLWLAEMATRREVSDELKRVKELAVTHKLSALNCFEGEIWEGFDHE